MFANEEPHADSAGSSELPTSPAFEALGATPSSVLRPSSVRALGADLKTSIGPGGLRPGFALETAPLWLWLGRNVTLRDWRDNLGDRMISRIALSFATQELADKRLAVAEGLRFVIRDDSDPRWDKQLEACLKRVANSTLPITAPKNPLEDATAGPTFAEAPAAAAQCRQDNVERARNAGNMQLAIAAATVQLTDPDGKNVAGKAIDLWLSASYATSRSQVLIGSLRASRDIELNITSATFGARAHFGNVRTTFALDVAGTLRRRSGGDGSGQAVFAAVFEQQVAEAIWIVANGGGRVGGIVESGQHLFVIVGLKVDSAAFPLFRRAL